MDLLLVQIGKHTFASLVINPVRNKLMMLSDQKLQYLVRNPLALLVAAVENIYTEDEWRRIWEWLHTHRMSDELLGLWVRNQEQHGHFRYKALGQLFARYADIGRGWSTVDKGIAIKRKHMLSGSLSSSNI